jgi:hypothetical protein
MSTCKKCQFFVQQGSHERQLVGLCKRFPPNPRPYDPNSVHASLGQYPLVSENDLCGEFKSIEHVIL